MDGGDYFGVNDGQTRVIPGQKSACRKFHHIRNDKRACVNEWGSSRLVDKPYPNGLGKSCP